jgi:predicted MPP superfamily phosphohydrolase
MTRDVLRVAVVSDIHAAQPDPDGNSPSYASTAPASEWRDRDAILSLEKLISDQGITTDYLVCCGDMANQADPTAMNYIWSKFNELATKLSAKPIATVGNHDVDSRHKHNDHDARGLLRGLKPPFPLIDKANNYEYWSRNFVVLGEPDIRFVVLNSCAYHGVNPDPDAPEYSHGRISDFTLGDLREAINENSDDYAINVLLCHHHPHKHQDIEVTDYSTMLGGEKLIDALAGSDVGTWLVMHGHKHQPRLLRGAGGGRAPMIFGAGSLSAKLHGDLSGKARNQFYIIEFHLKSARDLNLELAGEVLAWDYQLGKGWVKAKTDSGLPARSGFGYLISQVRRDAAEVSKIVASAGGISTWDQLLADFPELRYALPTDLELLQRELASRHNIGVVLDQFGTPVQFASRGS